MSPALLPAASFGAGSGCSNPHLSRALAPGGQPPCRNCLSRRQAAASLTALIAPCRLLLAAVSRSSRPPHCLRRQPPLSQCTQLPAPGIVRRRIGTPAFSRNPLILRPMGSVVPSLVDQCGLVPVSLPPEAGVTGVAESLGVVGLVGVAVRGFHGRLDYTIRPLVALRHIGQIFRLAPKFFLGKSKGSCALLVTGGRTIRAPPSLYNRMGRLAIGRAPVQSKCRWGHFVALCAYQLQLFTPPNACARNPPPTTDQQQPTSHHHRLPRSFAFRSENCLGWCRRQGCRGAGVQLLQVRRVVVRVSAGGDAGPRKSGVRQQAGSG